MEDIAALWLLDRVYDLVEERFGRAAAWVVTAALAAAIIAALIWILVRLLG